MGPGVSVRTGPESCRSFECYPQPCDSWRASAATGKGCNSGPASDTNGGGSDAPFRPSSRSLTMKPLIPWLLATSLVAQGTGSYFNVESPQVKPIAVARVAGHDYLLVCNTPDNAVEIFDTHTNARVARVRTGAEPISVKFNPVNGKLYTCNFLGDSLTIAALSATGPTAPLQVQLEGTFWVGDEPADLAFTTNGSTLLVTLSSVSQIRALDANTLAPVALVPGLADPHTLLTPTVPPLNAIVAVKEPRAIVVTPTAGGSLGRVTLVNHKGGKAGAVPGFAPYDIDLWTADLNTGAVTPKAVGSLGTTNLNLAAASNGDLWVVGTDALFPGTSVFNHAAAPTGFVRSLLFRVSNLAGTPTVAMRDLNTLATSTGVPGAPVAKAAAIAQPTDIALLERGGGVAKVYVTGFHSDKVGVVTPTGAATAWVVKPIAIPLVPQSNPGTVSGPRGLVLKSASGLAGDPGSRLYVMNRLDNSVTVIDTATDTISASFALGNDPTPAYIKTGRQFLYSSNFSGNGFVSCASCHLDGRTDNLGWDLSNGLFQPFPLNFEDGVIAQPGLFTGFPAKKRVMVTQSLQGLATYEVNKESQGLLSTEPLHWRGDKARFADFNEAFVNLQGMANIGTPSDPKGLTDAQMEQFRAAVFSIHYPPNPEEPITRTYSGALGDPNAIGTGTLAQEGMKLFHERGLGVSAGGIQCAGRSCVQCHALMSGGNKLFTVFGLSVLNVPALEAQPMESAALRLLRQKESQIVTNAGPTNSGIFTGIFGLEHEGKNVSLNDFNVFTFGADFSAPTEQTQLNQFTREFDTGTAPLVGVPFTVKTTTTPSSIANALTVGESQVVIANAGLAVQARINGVDRGFWYVPDIDRYREEPTGGLFTRANLLALVTASNDRLVFHSTPLGSERRFAWPTLGMPTPLTGAAPALITLQPMPANTAYTAVPKMQDNWDPLATGATKPFLWTSATPTPPSLRTMRIFQRALIAAGGFGIGNLRHEAPRRFAVSGTDIRHGAKLVVFVNADSNNPPLASTTFTPLILPLHMTNRKNSSGHTIWETHVELDPFVTYVMLLGGFAGKGVQQTIDRVFANTLLGETAPAGTFDPVNWNQHSIFVANEDGTWGWGGLQRLVLQ